MKARVGGNFFRVAHTNEYQEGESLKFSNRTVGLLFWSMYVATDESTDCIVILRKVYLCVHLKLFCFGVRIDIRKLTVINGSFVRCPRLVVVVLVGLPTRPHICSV